MVMEWDEISRRLRNGTSVQILADLEGVPYKTMYNRIKYYERRDGKKYMNKRKKEAPEEKAEADPEDNPRDLLPVFKAEAVPIQQTEANPEAVPELITVTKEVYETIKYKLDCCEISIVEAREAIRQEEKRRAAWAAILERLKIEDNPEGET